MLFPSYLLSSLLFLSLLNYLLLDVPCSLLLNLLCHILSTLSFLHQSIDIEINIHQQVILLQPLHLIRQRTLPIQRILQLLLIHFENIGLHLLQEQLCITLTVWDDYLGDPPFNHTPFDEVIQLMNRAAEVHDITSDNDVELQVDFLKLHPVYLCYLRFICGLILLDVDLYVVDNLGDIVT